MNQSVEISVKISTEVRIQVGSDVIDEDIIPVERENEIELFPDDTEETLTGQLSNALEDLKVTDFCEGTSWFV